MQPKIFQPKSCKILIVFLLLFVNFTLKFIEYLKFFEDTYLLKFYKISWKISENFQTFPKILLKICKYSLRFYLIFVFFFKISSIFLKFKYFPDVSLKSFLKGFEVFFKFFIKFPKTCKIFFWTLKVTQYFSHIPNFLKFQRSLQIFFWSFPKTFLKWSQNFYLNFLKMFFVINLHLS